MWPCRDLLYVKEAKFRETLVVGVTCSTPIKRPPVFTSLDYCRKARLYMTRVPIAQEYSRPRSFSVKYVFRPHITSSQLKRFGLKALCNCTDIDVIYAMMR